MRRGGVVGLAALGITLVAIFLAGLTRSVAGSFALITLAGIAGLGWSMRGWLPRAGVAASVAVLGWAPIVFIGVAWQLGHPLVTSHWRCGTGDANMLELGVVALVVSSGLLLGLATVLARTRIVDGIVRSVAIASVLVGIVIAVFAIARRGVEPDAYVAQLPIVGGDVAGVRIEREGCIMTFETSDRTTTYPMTDDRACFPLRVRHDAAHGRFVVESAHPDWYPVHAFDTRTLESVDITPHDVRDALKPPAEWVASAVAGVGAALAALVLAIGLDRRARRFRRGHLTQGTHTGEGWIELGSAIKHVPEAQHLPIGPVVFEARDGRAATYRADGSPEVRRVRAGTLGDWLDRTLDVRASAFAFAIAAVALSCAPLLAARFVGLF